MKAITPFHYFGGKSPFLPFLFNHLPADVHLVDAMCGSAAVGLNAPNKLVTLNDINEDIFNFFQVLRTDLDKFMHQVQHTPFSRQEFLLTRERTDEPIEQARRFFIRAIQGFGGSGSQHPNQCNWAPEVSGMNMYNGKMRTHFKCHTWEAKIQLLPVIAKKLRTMQIEHDDVIKIINRYNKKNVCIYLDPPYDKKIRGNKNRYLHEFRASDHEAIAAAVQDHPGFIAVSGYSGTLYDELFPSSRWFRTYDKVRKANTANAERTEVLFTNYDPRELKNYSKNLE